jgi:hypothetical protein
MTKQIEAAVSHWKKNWRRRRRRWKIKYASD